MQKTDIHSVISKIEDWKNKEISYEPVSGGITNPNFKVRVDQKSFFLKIPGQGTEYIDRATSHAANILASDKGIGPEVCYYFEDTGVEVFEWLDGYRMMTFKDVYNPKIRNKVIRNIKRFHEGGNLPQQGNLVEQAWEMRSKAKETAFEIPWNNKMEYLLKVIEEAFQKSSIPLKPCHNDFWSNNIMYNEQTSDIRIIDFEYATMGDPYADLGTISTINYFTEEMDKVMMNVYEGGNTSEKAYARMKLYKIVSDIKWAYWAVYQSSHSNVDYDYMNWYGIKMARLQHLWLDSRLDYWLTVLAG